jgi:hypothetical protein
MREVLCSIAIAAAGALAACSSGNSTAATAGALCPLQTANCWNTAIAEAQACVPQTAGTFGSDDQTCTFADGTIVTFDVPVTFPIDVSKVNPSLAVTKGGAQCARAVHKVTGLTFMLVTKSGTYGAVVSLSGETLTCGDGTTLATTWSDCEDDAGAFDSTGEVAFAESSGGNDLAIDFQGYFPDDGGFSSGATWFDCQKP